VYVFCFNRSSDLHLNSLSSVFVRYMVVGITLVCIHETIAKMLLYVVHNGDMQLHVTCIDIIIDRAHF